MIIHGLNKTTLLDFPGHVAATVFTGGCNFRCPFCHNSELVLDPNSQPIIENEEFFRFLKKRQGILEGVCITGGEPTINPDLNEFITSIKEMGYLVKLDTNGYKPEVVDKLIKDRCIDYIAMDIKSGISGYGKAVGFMDLNMQYIEKSIDIIMNSGVEYEFRTTLVKGIHTKDDILEISKMIRGAKRYFLQDYRDNENVMVKGFEPFSKEEMEEFASFLQKDIPSVAIRGID